MTTTGAIRLTIPAPRDLLADAIALVCADLRLMDHRRDGMPDHALIDRADDITDQDIADALHDGEIDQATADAYALVWAATSAQISTALAEVTR